MAQSAQPTSPQIASDSSSPFARWLDRVAFVVGSVGLLGAMSADALAVLGRHIGLPLLGSIEIVQACVVLLAAAAMIGATVGGAHASVHILVNRLGAAGRRTLLRFSDAISAGVFLIFAISSIWIAVELWPGNEHSELLHIPLRWLRALWIASALLIAAVFLVRALSRKDQPA